MKQLIIFCLEPVDCDVFLTDSFPKIPIYAQVEINLDLLRFIVSIII